MGFARRIAPYIEDFIQYYLDRGQKSEAYCSKSQLKYFVRFMSSQRGYIGYVSELGRKDIELFIEYLWNVEYGSGFSGKGYLSRNNFVYRCLRATDKFFEYLTIQEDKIDDKFLPGNDLFRKKDFPSPHRRGTKHFPRWFEKFLHSKILELPEATEAEFRFKSIMLVLYHLGARIKDVCTIESDCLTKKHGVAWIKIFSNKTKFWYEVPLARELKKRLDRQLERTVGLVRQHPTTHQDANFLFWVEPGKQFPFFVRLVAESVKAFCESVREQAAAAGLPVREIQTLSLTSHKFRHTVAIRLIRIGADPMLVAEFLGHSDLSMAQAYIQESQQEIDDLMAELWDDDTLGLSEELVDGFDYTRDELFAFPGVISKVDCGHCAHVGGKPPCGEGAYDCWLCDKLKPIFDDPEYPGRLREHLADHRALYDRNVHLGHLGAAKMEQAVIKRIQGILDEVAAEGRG